METQKVALHPSESTRRLPELEVELVEELVEVVEVFFFFFLSVIL